ncbi:hypothetical protein [Taibaiella koreensis]|uniref:hypothetical protein n=1 Tax=Taibaiella koreensis TaxID=1268548 RepID=UPI000E59B9B0|nr:hypothetical protein [Taibaiella koreensis]
MAIIIEGQSLCSLCQATLGRDKVYILTPPLTGNTKDPLFPFSDAGIHLECRDRLGIKEKLLEHIYLYEEGMPPANQRCVVDGERIANPRDLLCFGLLTSVDTEELHCFNYLSFNSNNINTWDACDRFLALPRQFLSEGKWEGMAGLNKLAYIVERVAAHRQG